MVGDPNGWEAAVLNISWIGDETLETESCFALAGMGEIPFSSMGNSED